MVSEGDVRRGGSDSAGKRMSSCYCYSRMSSGSSILPRLCYSNFFQPNRSLATKRKTVVVVDDCRLEHTNDYDARQGFFLAQALFAKSPNPRNLYQKNERKLRGYPNTTKAQHSRSSKVATMQKDDLGEIKGRDED